jgi:hypothetical protein
MGLLLVSKIQTIKKEHLHLLKMGINGIPYRASWIIRYPVLYWFIGQNDCK